MNKERTRSQVAKGARSKGKKAEREVAKLLGLWFFADSSSFHCVPASGGLRWSKDVAKTRGDIVCSADSNFPYSIEIKNQEKSQWDLLSLLFNEGPIIQKWWKQCEEDAEAVGKIPWLIFTRNQVPFITMISHHEGTYLNYLPKNGVFLYDDLYILPLALLLDANPSVNKGHLIEGYFTEPSDNKIFQRHYINVLNRINKDAVSK